MKTSVLSAIEKQRVLDFLNQMEVTESEGGDCAYASVENNETNRELLKEAGIPLETALQYGDEESFCIIALACGEGYATWYDGTKLHNYDRTYLEIALIGLKDVHESMLNKPRDVGHQSDWLSGFGAAIDYLEENF